MTGYTAVETHHGNPGEKRVLPKGVKVSLVRATNLPSGSDIYWWATPVDPESVSPDVMDWAEDVGLGLGEDEVENPSGVDEVADVNVYAGKSEGKPVRSVAETEDSSDEAPPAGPELSNLDSLAKEVEAPIDPKHTTDSITALFDDFPLIVEVTDPDEDGTSFIVTLVFESEEDNREELIEQAKEILETAGLSVGDVDSDSDQATIEVMASTGEDPEISDEQLDAVKDGAEKAVKSLSSEEGELGQAEVQVTVSRWGKGLKVSILIGGESPVEAGVDPEKLKEVIEAGVEGWGAALEVGEETDFASGIINLVPEEEGKEEDPEGSDEEPQDKEEPVEEAVSDASPRAAGYRVVGSTKDGIVCVDARVNKGAKHLFVPSSNGDLADFAYQGKEYAYSKELKDGDSEVTGMKEDVSGAQELWNLFDGVDAVDGVEESPAQPGTYFVRCISPAAIEGVKSSLSKIGFEVQAAQSDEVATTFQVKKVGSVKEEYNPEYRPGRRVKVTGSSHGVYARIVDSGEDSTRAKVKFEKDGHEQVLPIMHISPASMAEEDLTAKRLDWRKRMERAEGREDRDDHLSPKERKALVDEAKKLWPHLDLKDTDDVDSQYVFLMYDADLD